MWTGVWDDRLNRCIAKEQKTASNVNDVRRANTPDVVFLESGNKERAPLQMQRRP